MNISEPSQNRIAVLIDADNAQPSITEGLLSEIANREKGEEAMTRGMWSTRSQELQAPERRFPSPPSVQLTAGGILLLEFSNCNHNEVRNVNCYD